MNEQMKEDMRLRYRQKVIQILILLVMGIVFYLVLGQKWISIEDDTPFYLNPRREGVMPVYPLFLFVSKCIFGENLYLDAVVVIQSVLAIICTMIFVLYLEKQFQLRWIETILLYAACMLPFSIYLPESGITHQILTEGLSYAFFYLYFILLLQYVFTKKRGWILATTAMAGFMELLRSQMLFLLGVTAAVFVCVEFAKRRKEKISRRIVGTGVDCVAGVIGILLVVSLVYKIFGWYWVHQIPIIENWGQKTVTEQNGGEAEGAIVIVQEAADGETGQSAVRDETDVSSANAENQRSMSQLTTLILIRGFYEIDENDIELFEKPEMIEIFQKIYDALDAKEYRYAYARQDLYMWQDLVKDEIPWVVVRCAENYYEKILDANDDNVYIRSVQICREIGLKLLLHHFDRYLYHSFRMMISGFISSVFFQIEKIYLLCHIITLLLYLMAAVGIIYCLKKGGNRKAAALALTTLAYIFLMVFVTNLVFLGLQRYMVYAMGIFYCSLYLLAREALLITAEGSEWIKITKH